MRDPWVIWCGMWGQYWGPKRGGYYSLLGAGLYSEAEAKEIVSHSGPERREEALSLADAIEREHGAIHETTRVIDLFRVSLSALPAPGEET